MVVLCCMEEPVLSKFAGGSICWATPPTDDKFLSFSVEIREGDDDDDDDNGIDVAPAA